MLPIWLFVKSWFKSPLSVPVSSDKRVDTHNWVVFLLMFVLFSWILYVFKLWKYIPNPFKKKTYRRVRKRYSKYRKRRRKRRSKRRY